jgi:DNA-binding transcriptional regulator YiaG
MPRKISKRTSFSSEESQQLEIKTVEVEVLPDADFERPVRTRSSRIQGLPRTEPPLFENKSIETIATGAPVLSATQAFLRTPDWSEFEPGRLYFQRQFGKGRFIQFFVLNKQQHQAGSITSQAEAEILNQYGVMAARLHAIFATYASIQNEPWKQPFYLLGTDLIKTLRIRNSHKFTKSDKLKAIAELAWVVGTLGAVVTWREGDLDLCIRERSLLWIVSVEEYTQTDLNTQEEELREVVIRVQPGQWTLRFLNREGAQQRKALYQYGLIPEPVFAIDPNRHKMATSMALYLIQNSRAHPQGIYRVSTLLESVLPGCDIQRAISDRRYGWKLKESVDNALLTLKDHLHIDLEFDDLTYPLWLRPLWSLPSELADLPAKERNQALLGSKCLPNNYLTKQWFPAKLMFTLPESIQNQIDSMGARRLLKTPSNSLPAAQQELNLLDALPKSEAAEQVIAGATIKSARQAQGLTQSALAKRVNKSVSWIKMVECDKRRAGKEDQELLCQVLNI